MDLFLDSRMLVRITFAQTELKNIFIDFVESFWSAIYDWLGPSGGCKPLASCCDVRFAPWTTKLWLLTSRMKNKLFFDYMFLLEALGPFSMEKFVIFPLEQKIEYAKQTLPLVSAEGGGRIVFDLGNNKVLKIARNDRKTFQGGINQNKKEIEIYNKFKSLNFFPHMFEFDHNNFEWIVYEKVNTFEMGQKDALEPFVGLHDDELEQLMGWKAKYTIDQSIHPEKYPELEEQIEEDLEFYPGWRENKYLKKIFFLIDHGLHPEELIVRTHYGTTSDGRLVLVDFGH